MPSFTFWLNAEVVAVKSRFYEWGFPGAGKCSFTHAKRGGLY